jgi:dTMP kinase
MSSIPPSLRRGAFILLEGLDRSGKTTQCKLLSHRLSSDSTLAPVGCVQLRFPDRTTTVGQMIDGYLKGTTEIEDHAVHLLFAANRWEAR